MSEVRLFKAARRTIRAECTLVIFIVIIISWSIYALYKLNIGGSDSILGLSINRLIGGESHGDKSANASSNSVVTSADHLVASHQQPSEETNQSPIYLPPAEIKQRSNLLRQLIAARRRQLSQDIHQRNGGPEPSDDIDHDRIYAFRAPNALAALERLRLNNHEHQKQQARLLQQQLASQRQYAQTYHLPVGRSPSLITAPQVRDPRVTTKLNELLQRQLTSRDRDEETSEEEPVLSPEDETESPSTSNRETGDEPESENQTDRVPSGSSISDTSSSGQHLVEETSQPTQPESEPEATESGDNSNVTTEAPISDVAEDGEQDREPLEDEDRSPTESIDEQAARDHQDSTEAEPTAEDEAKALETGKAIDEDVDRMTQPSSGIASRQDKPFDYKSTVQFDDALSSADPTLVKGIKGLKSKRNRKKKLDEGRPEILGSQIARFLAPSRRRNLDLEVDHNLLLPVNNHGKIGGELRKIKSKSVAKPSEKSPNSKVDVVKTENKTNATGKAIIKQRIRLRRWSIDSGVIGPANATDLAPKNNNISVQRSGKKRKRRKRLYEAAAPSIKRSDDDSDEYEGEEDDYEEAPSNEVEKQGEQQNHDKEHQQQEAGDALANEPRASRPDDADRQHVGSPAYYHLTSADANLQELLDQQRLLDALTQSQLPAPLKPESTNQNITHKAKDKDKIGADSQITIEEGLLLYPASGMEHHHKSMKKKKAHKSKHKKKMTLAMKKGGYKKKKHKKELKKYLKEKKFKGAKKGKKSSKGKGGQGGKKGKKFYKDKGFKKKGFKNVYHKEEFGQKKSYFDEFRDKDFKKKWKKYDDKYNYAKMKKWQAKDVKGAKKMKDQGEKYKKYDKGKWKKKYMKHHEEKKKKKMASEWDR